MHDEFSIVVEAASINAVRTFGEAILRSGRDIVILSVGALAEEDFREHLVGVAREEGKKIRIPSGAILGLDNLKIGQVSSATATPPPDDQTPGVARDGCCGQDGTI